MKLKSMAISTCLITLSLFLSPTALADNSSPTTSETDNYISLSGSASAKQGLQSALTSTYLGGYDNFTLELWMMPAETLTTTTGTIFVKTDRFQFDLVNGVFYAWLNSNGWKGSINTGVKARIGEWQHVAYIKNGNLLSLYLNGTLVFELSDATNVPTTLTNNSTYTSIGSNPWNSGSVANLSSPQMNFFAGGLDEVKFWSGARTQSQIRTSMTTKMSPTSTNLVGYWDFNGTSNTSTIYDRTGSFNFTVFGTPAPTFPDIKTVTTSTGAATIAFPRTYLNGTGGYQIPSNVSSLNILVVGGGGGGGFDGGGGGGGGGVYQNTSLSVTPGSSVAVEVGTGGAAVNGYTGGTLTCNGVWNGSALACSSAAGGTSKFGNTSASGGGGAGGIEANGTNDSDATANTRGGGGGGGGQNSRVGGSSAGVGATSGGSVSDTANSGGGGGGSGTNAGSIGTVSAAGNGGTGTTATLNSVIYGSGGAGGSFSSATVATGGTGAANGGTTGVAPTIPAVNRGGGGGGGGNGGIAGNANGTTGAAGVIIIRYVLKGDVSISYGASIKFRTTTSLTTTTSSSGKVTFYANGKKIPGCINMATSGSPTITATCTWKPSMRGSVNISSTFTPSDSNYLSNTATGSVFVLQRASAR